MLCSVYSTQYGVGLRARTHACCTLRCARYVLAIAHADTRDAVAGTRHTTRDAILNAILTTHLSLGLAL